MRAMHRLSKAIVAVLVFSFLCVLFAKSPQDTPILPAQPVPQSMSRLPFVPEFAKILVKPNVQDDSIKRLQRLQLIEAIMCLKVCIARFESGQHVVIADLHKYHTLAVVAAFDLAETKEKKIECLEFMVDASKRSEAIFASAMGGQLDASTAKYWRLDAEINLLKFKRDSMLAQDPNRLDK